MKNDWIKGIVKKLTTPEGRDYTYLTLFFLIFSIFVFAAIRPSLKTAFSLKKEQVSLVELDQNYEKAIERIIAIQLNLEKMRDRLPLLSEAIPQRPNVNKLISDIEAIGERNSVALSEVTVGEVNLKQRGSTNIKILQLRMKTSSSFPNLMRFLAEVSAGRRIKLPSTINITRAESEGATPSGSLGIVLEVEGYHL